MECFTKVALGKNAIAAVELSPPQPSGYLSEFGIEENRHLHALSFGQKKKVFNGFALSTNARVLIMDESTNGLILVKLWLQISSRQTHLCTMKKQKQRLRIFLNRRRSIERYLQWLSAARCFRAHQYGS